MLYTRLFCCLIFFKTSKKTASDFGQSYCSNTIMWPNDVSSPFAENAFDYKNMNIK